ncbi:MAG: hypothetical protein J5654_04140 [Victivallales bacterium]|nr:hypothetical protein [Victivallales bacterium]
MSPVLENSLLRIEVDSEHGGRVTSFFAKTTQTELLWYDATRLPVNPTLDYDGNFAGGMDELLPCDPPEHGFPDHGELWTQPLRAMFDQDKLILEGRLPKCGLVYRRIMLIDNNCLICKYLLENTMNRPLDFLWKLHAALAISPGDRLLVPANCCQAADPGDWSKATTALPSHWKNVYDIPPMDGSSDFFYLTDLADGNMELLRGDGVALRCDFDMQVFPCAWVFASFGRLNGSRTLIMEPCTNYPLSLDDAVKAKCCAHLDAGESLATEVRWSVR